MRTEEKRREEKGDVAFFPHHRLASMPAPDSPYSLFFPLPFLPSPPFLPSLPSPPLCSYYKTGSLIANSCKSVALLGGYPQPICDAAFRYGLHVGVAFQLVDDLLDFEGTAASLGKPALNDLKQGLSTAPVLFAASQYPATLLPLMERKFDRPGDVDAAVRCVAESDGMASTRRLAVAHGQRALEVLQVLRPSPERTALAAMVTKVLSRTR